MWFIMNFFQNMFFEKKHVFLPKMASVTLHIPKDFWWHRIFGSATIFWVRKFWSTWSRGGGVHGEVSWPIDYYPCCNESIVTYRWSSMLPRIILYCNPNFILLHGEVVSFCCLISLTINLCWACTRFKYTNNRNQENR